MMTVSVRELKNGLSRYLRRAQAGEEIVVTSHGKPIGRLLGPPQAAATSDSDTMARLRQQSWLRPGNGQPLHATPPAEVQEGTGEEVLRWLRGE